MRREGKAGSFIPCEVRAQIGLAHATTPAVARRRRQATTAVGARAKAYPHGRRRLRPGGNACARARTHAPGRQRLRPCDDRCCVGGVFFHKHPKLQRSGDDVCIRVTTPVFERRRPCSRDDVWILFFKRWHFFMLWQSKQNFSIISF